MENREIKFRVWDNVDYMSSPFTLQNLQERKIQFASDCVVMQFTGLLDKNGKEIYEGDICTFYNKYSKTDYTRVVRYCSMLACFGLYPNMEEVWQYESDWLKISSLEIIGNVHQHPELLTTKPQGK